MNIHNPKASVSDVVTTFESGSLDGDLIRSEVQSKDTKIPINMYFAKTTKNSVLFLGEYMEIYVSQKEIERKTAIISGRELNLFGVFEIRIWDQAPKNPENEKPKYITRYMFPSRINTIPSSLSKRSVSVAGGDPEPHLVLGYRKRDVFIANTVLVQSSTNVSQFIKTIFGAFVSKLVRYDDLVPLVLESSRLNAVSFDLNATTLEMIFAAQARWSKDLTVPYRIFLNKNGSDKPLNGSEMTFVKINDLAHIASTFTSFSFQNIDYAITSSARRHRTGQKQTESSVEKIIKY